MHTGIHGSHGKGVCIIIKTVFQVTISGGKAPGHQNMRTKRAIWRGLILAFPRLFKDHQKPETIQKKTNFKTSDGSWQYSQALLSDFQIRETVTVCPEQDLVN